MSLQADKMLESVCCFRCFQNPESLKINNLDLIFCTRAQARALPRRALPATVRPDRPYPLLNAKNFPVLRESRARAGPADAIASRAVEFAPPPGQASPN